VRPVSLQDLRRIAETLAAVRGRSVAGPQLEVDVVRQPAEHGHQLEVRFESA
jgi:hypothetical protein